MVNEGWRVKGEPAEVRRDIFCRRQFLFSVELLVFDGALSPLLRVGVGLRVKG